MTISPFATFANATLRFQIVSGNLAIDPKTGNQQPGTAVLQVEALLQQKRDPNRTIRPGVDSSAVWLEGYAIEPMLLPNVVTPDSRAAAVWDSKQGEFFLELTGRSPYGVAPITGDKIRGYFQISQFIVQGDPWMPTPTSTPDSGQLTEPIVAATSLSALRVVTLDDSGQLIYADSGNLNHAFALIGILPAAVGLGNSIAVLTDGSLSDTNWNWNPRVPIFLGSNGQLTQTVPSSGFLVQVARAIAPTLIDFEIQQPEIL
jgi:hypothetical protein